jgi:hypothetical protein
MLLNANPGKEQEGRRARLEDNAQQNDPWAYSIFKADIAREKSDDGAACMKTETDEPLCLALYFHRKRICRMEVSQPDTTKGQASSL